MDVYELSVDLRNGVRDIDLVAASTATSACCSAKA